MEYRPIQGRGRKLKFFSSQGDTVRNPFLRVLDTACVTGWIMACLAPACSLDEKERDMAYTSRPINPEVRIIDGGAVTNTHNMAWVFRFNHEELLREVYQLDCTPAFRETNFTEVSYTDPEGQIQRMFRVKRDGFILLARKFTGERAETLQQAYIEAFNQLEENLRHFDPSYKNPFLDISALDMMKLQASIEAERRILKRAGY